MQVLGFRGLGLKGFKVKVSGCDLSRAPRGERSLRAPSGPAQQSSGGVAHKAAP